MSECYISDACEEGYELGSAVGLFETVSNPYSSKTQYKKFKDWWRGFDNAIEDRVS